MKKVFVQLSLALALIACSGESIEDRLIEKPQTPQETPKTPETPKKPETPETPETPKKPETPETPKQPDNPSKETGEIKVPLKLKAYYLGVDFSKAGNAFRDELAAHTIKKHHTFLGYGQRNQYLSKADADPAHRGNAILLYTGESRNYNSANVNTEHVFPQSKLSDARQQKGDLHHLRACDKDVNSARGNLPFTQGSGRARKVGGGWYPSDEFKGDVARMVMYMNLHYNLPWNKISTSGVELMLKWNAEDPVSALEQQRNNVIESAQGNRNPFIDNPYLATKIWGGNPAENTWK
ncbi:endonuclease I family protein [Capnocytophaga gingivalis]|uniref:endonuclease I family protein n=1 Tax=Capnocytophaga gingivalis TaxID=1017 RepID=UPI0023553A3D|nr:endonuclease [Capnocytophaga gingivalis]